MKIMLFHNQPKYSLGNRVGREYMRLFLGLLAWISSFPITLDRTSSASANGGQRIPIDTVRWKWAATAQNAGDEANRSEGNHHHVCDGFLEPRPGAMYSVVGHLNYGVGLKPHPDIAIPGACEVNLPIHVRSR